MSGAEPPPFQGPDAAEEAAVDHAPAAPADGQRPAEVTRARLLDAATQVFADQGIHAASLLEVTRLAGQRNRGAVHYHFGSREGILQAILARHLDALSEHESRLLDEARRRPDDDVASVLAAIVEPVVALADTDWRGACFLRIIRQVVEQDPATLPPEVNAMLERTVGPAIFVLLRERLQRVRPMSDDLESERLALVTSFILTSAADRAGARERPDPRRPRLSGDRFTANLVAVSTGLVTAPVV